MKKLVEFAVSSVLVFGLFGSDCSGMRQRSSSDSNVPQSKGVSGVCDRDEFSEPITAAEKVRAIEVTDMNQFKRLTKSQANELESITFRGIEINEEFVDKFWELFSSGIEELSFEDCRTVGGCSLPCLFDSLYQVANLKIIGCGLSVQDAGTVLSLVSPYTIRTIDFSGNGLNEQDPLFKNMIGQWITNRVCLDSPIRCAP